jgi:hypothetical protein
MRHEHWLQNGGINGLGQMMIETCLLGATPVNFFTVAGDGNQLCPRGRRVSAQLSCNTIAIKPRQADVAQNNIWGPLVW